MDTWEGATHLGTPPTGTVGPGTRDKDVPFYNPAMSLNRDLSVLMVTAEARRRGRDLEVADPLCGAGARTLRLANEVDADLVVHANDLRPDAVAHLAYQAHRLGMETRVQTTRLDAPRFLTGRRFDVVDVDPYGSPMPFLDAAVGATRHDGLLCVTATDTAALCGTYPKPCRRRYGAEHRLHVMPWRAEVGLRILAGAAVRAAGRAERAAVPLLSVARGHWMRVVLRVTDGAGQADAAARALGWAVPDARGGGSWQWAPPSGDRYAGPLWGGPLHDAELVARMQTEADRRAAEGRTSPEERAGTEGPLAQGRAVGRLLTTLAAEAQEGVPPFWVPMDRFAGAHSRSTPPREALFAALLEAGHGAWPSHMDPKGVRTHATTEELAAAVVASTAKPL